MTWRKERISGPLLSTCAIAQHNVPKFAKFAPGDSLSLKSTCSDLHPRYLSQLCCHLHWASAMLVARHPYKLTGDQLTYGIHCQQAPIVGLRCHFHCVFHVLFLYIWAHHMLTDPQPCHERSTQASALTLLSRCKMNCLTSLKSIRNTVYLNFHCRSISLCSSKNGLKWSQWSAWSVWDLSRPLTQWRKLVSTAGHTGGALGFLSNWESSTEDNLTLDLRRISFSMVDGS